LLLPFLVQIFTLPHPFVKEKKQKITPLFIKLHYIGRETMSTHSKKRDLPRHEEAGRIIASRVREARKIHGFVVCPVCHSIFDATSLLKCPRCRTFLEKTFRQTHGQKKNARTRRKKASQADSKKMELDFFTK
jgi:uncharacterized paraquat-inducible protein A